MPIPWEHSWNDPSPPSSPGSSTDSASLSDVEMTDNQTGQYHQDDDDDQDDQADQPQPLQAGLQDDAQGAPSVSASPLLPNIHLGQLIFDPNTPLEFELDMSQTHFPGDSEVTDSEQTDDDSNYGPSHKPPPEIAPYRLNLTALSQRYNMYAAAYADEIHIYRVPDCVNHNLGHSPGRSAHQRRIRVSFVSPRLSRP